MEEVEKYEKSDKSSSNESSGDEGEGYRRDLEREKPGLPFAPARQHSNIGGGIPEEHGRSTQEDRQLRSAHSNTTNGRNTAGDRQLRSAQSNISRSGRNVYDERQLRSAHSNVTRDGDLPLPQRPQRLHANSSVTVTSSVRERQLEELPRPIDVNCATAEDTGTVASERPPLKRKLTKLANKKSHPLEHIGITLGLPMIALCDLVIPCIIYYTWYLKHRSKWQRDCRDWHNRGESCPIEKPQFDEDIMGTAVAMFGIGELYVLLARVWRLFFRTEQCAPLLSRSRWELDATSWVYLVAMLIALIPFVTGASLVQPELYLYGPSFLMSFLGILMVITTLLPFKIPIGINSHERGTAIRPFVYYAAEDFIAVDGLQDREFRIRYNERYETSKAFRRMFVMLTLWWELGVATYIGCVSAVIWLLPFHIAFGLSLGVLFGYIATWAAGSAVYVNWEMDRQRKMFEEGKLAA